VFRSEDLLSYLKELRPGRFRFASQLALDILFSLCRIGEVWLTKKQGKDKGFLNAQLEEFFKNHYSRIIGNDLGTYNNSCKNDFEGCLKMLLNNEQVLSPKNTEPWESDLILIYVLRKEAGHAATSSDILNARFEELLERVFFGLFKIIEAL
ncbi:MAG: hypothetical protein U1B77_01535, partial [Dehalococcoidales bacterium]|nr:hypothetical protein [Dehalococcoidales bacterium]